MLFQSQLTAALRLHFRFEVPAFSAVSFSIKFRKPHFFPYLPCSLSLLYAYGNLELAQGQTLKAKVDYEEGYKMSADLSPTHILTAIFQYRLGVVEAVLGSYIKAL